MCGLNPDAGRESSILRGFAVFVTLSIAGSSNIALGQQQFPSTNLQPKAGFRTIFEHEITTCIAEWRPLLMRNTLSQDGKLALINDTLAEETLLVDTVTLEVTELKIKNPVCAAWFDSESDYVYTASLEEKIDFREAKFSPGSGDYDKLSCYANIDALKEGTVLWESDNQYSTVQWIPGNTHRVRLFMKRPVGVSQTNRIVGLNRNNSTVLVENASGEEVAKHSVEGTVVGVDGDEGQILIYHVVGHRIGKEVLRCTALSANGKELQDSRNIGLYGLPLPLGRQFWRVVQGTRPFRLRGLQSGDVTHYFTKLAPNISYWQFQDYEGTGTRPQDFLGRFSFVEKARSLALNKSAWRSDPGAFEVFMRYGNHINPFLANHRGAFMMLPCSTIHDAVFEESRIVLIGTRKRIDFNKDSICIMTIEPNVP